MAPDAGIGSLCKSAPIVSLQELFWRVVSDFGGWAVVWVVRSGWRAL